MDHRDTCGLALTLRHGDSPADWDRTVRAFLRHCAETPLHLGRVLEREPDFALGWAAKGLFTLLLGRAELEAPARDACRQARAAIDRVGATAREGAYVDALEAYLAGRPSAAVGVLEGILEATPQDALAFKLDQAIRFVLGDRRGMVRMTGGLLPTYDESHPFGAYVLGCHAFALEENGAFDAAETAGRAALERAPDDAWGLHAVAHVYDMTARNETGIRWLSDHVENWSHCNNFGGHIWWHLALLHLDQGDYDRVLALYDEKVRAEHTDDYRDIANGASMLMRLEIEGIDVGTRWDELAALAEHRVEPGCVVFADLHYILALGGAGDAAASDRLVARLAKDAALADHDMHEVAALAGHTAAMGLAAFRAGDYSSCFDLLTRAQRNMQRVGGSHAQRDVFSRVTIEAGIRAGRLDEAEAATRARASRRGAEDGFTARRLDAIDCARRAAFAAE